VVAVTRLRCENAKCRAFLRMGNAGPLCDPCERAMPPAELDRLASEEGYRGRDKGGPMRELGKHRRAAIMRVLEGAGELPLRDIAERIECSRESVQRHMHRLIEEGQVVMRRERMRASGSRYLYSVPVDIEALMGAKDEAA